MLPFSAQMRAPFCLAASMLASLNLCLLLAALVIKMYAILMALY